MAGETTTASGGEQLTLTYYHKRAQDRLVANFFFYHLGQKINIPKNSGKIAQFYRFDNVNVSGLLTGLTEASVPTATQLTAATSTVTLVQYGAYAKLSDLLVLTHRTDMMDQASDILGTALSETVDTIIRNTIYNAVSTQTANVYGQDLTKTSSSITTADILAGTTIRKLVREMKKNKVRPYRDQDAYIGVFSPSQLYDLKSDTNAGGIIDTAKYANPKQIYAGEAGKLWNMRILETTQISTAASTQITSTVTADIGLVFGENSFIVTGVEGGGPQLILKQPGSAGAADPLNQFGSVGFKCTFGTAYVGTDGPRIRRLFTAISA